MATTTSQFGSFYDEKRAASDLRQYRKNGPIPSTQALIAALRAEGVEGATLLDIGGGIGAVHHELVDAGVARATLIEASAAYLDAARKESERRGHDQVTHLHGDFVELAGSVPSADVVTLDRVINVYPEWERLLGLAAQHAQYLCGLVYPRDTRSVRFVVVVMNGVLRLLRKQVRASVRPVDAVERVLREHGLSPHTSQRVGPWQVAVYRRP
jgi:magnesium-protoporphyrin O-methyltransferase